MRISFHQDSVVVADLCSDLKAHGAVYWHTTRPNFKLVFDLIKVEGPEVIPLCARPGGDFANFLVRADLVDDLRTIEQRVAEAIVQWQFLSEPFPHIRSL